MNLTNSKNIGILIVTAVALFLSSCDSPDQSSHDPVSMAANNPNRLETDWKQDSNRKPAEVLRFFGIKPGMKVLDIMSGGGYYTEILNYLVGEEGRVIAHNNKAFEEYENKAIALRYEGGRLANVDRYIADANNIEIEANSQDAALLILAFHDIFYKPEDESWPTIDEEKFLTSILSAVKPGGVVGVVDHRALAGSSPDTGNTIHRIDPAYVIAALEKYGLKLEASSDILSNPNDDLSQRMWLPGIKHKTDRFVLRFRKPN